MSYSHRSHSGPLESFHHSRSYACPFKLDDPRGGLDLQLHRQRDPDARGRQGGTEPNPAGGDERHPGSH